MRRAGQRPISDDYAADVRDVSPGEAGGGSRTCRRAGGDDRKAAQLNESVDVGGPAAGRRYRCPTIFEALVPAISPIAAQVPVVSVVPASADVRRQAR
ncbi:hypothetical protein [Streptomyces sp. NPDC001604]|uniref:hypothetical protein n=1 Tax=Streptomyces sp. NPDC001604 TaxID=3364593 RepID=UPI0036BBDEE9